MTKKIFKYILIFIGAEAVLWFLYECPFQFLFGMSCPGCGMTRAFLSIIRLDFEMAFYYHPLFIVGILMCIFTALELLGIYKLNEKLKKKLVIIAGILLFGCWIIRIILKVDVVAFHFEKSIYYKIYSLIFSR